MKGVKYCIFLLLLFSVVVEDTVANKKFGEFFPVAYGRAMFITINVNNCKIRAQDSK